MSAVSRERAVRVEPAAARTAVRWRVSASAVSLPAARAWITPLGVTDVMLVCVLEDDTVAHFSLEAAGQRLDLCTAAARVQREAPLTHLDVFDTTGKRLLAATLSGERALYAVTTLWDHLGVAGGRYELG
ncbi:MAG TPA: hypothetical protein VHN77_10030 [Phycisphaerales bacterium]|nr:hypothetical protein [Phycisphaerales bacterium]